ncbi:transmembrane sensor [Parabacteroides sp. PF5-5]|uniref:FecR family protein n=1 Tax=unclassified Parabacteroides TaxID=2649774 RepID=UPI0024749641|nr:MULTISPECIES: FecR family protein [unclassified Parabacteroides]MDH6306444.1 transmembrane sensor [Parabacteroides sp. PH5-39]MDH6317404.1 transmembrane sensor [Parabacteroides sp. PF5-13]MDH6321155.1 transmembrane sensor [Parabacteroides sp. PH5-13]MDH6324887.1 transmembrane sensor [Parabacteroides sp. PH5-8]MDH6328589.1 transmembrane sensor [Parabacteroides sp. PH5-41]
MDKRILYRFYEGSASQQEKEEVKNWVDSSSLNKEEFMREREFFDAILLSGYKRNENKQLKGHRSSTIRRELLRLVAAIALLIIAGVSFYQLKINEINTVQNTIIVPAGQRVNLILPDGTNVWLNALTELKYPSFFNGSTREVYLNGEAYFDVKPTGGKRFVVHTERYDVEVLGTSFNVEAYNETGKFSTALMEGSVKIVNRSNEADNITLERNQKAYVSSQGLLASSIISDFDMYRWKDGLICFKNTNFIELMNWFEKYYDIDIIIENERLADHVFSGKFRISDGIDNALRILQKDAKYTYIRDIENAVIYIK